MRLTPLACLTALAFLFAAAPVAKACTPTYPTPENIEQDNVRARYLMPNVWEQARKAADIAIARADYVDGPETDAPEYARGPDNLSGEDLRPVRYFFTVVRVLKGAPPQRFAFQPAETLMLWRGRPNTWMTRWNESLFSLFHVARGDREFWRRGTGSMGWFSNGPGDCSNQIAFRTEPLYLVMRDEAGVTLLADVLDDNDPLPDLIEAYANDPAAPVFYSLPLADYLKLDGPLLRVRVTRCEPLAAVILEEMKGYGIDAYAVGEQLFPEGRGDISIPGCRRGGEYLFDDGPNSSVGLQIFDSSGLYPIDGDWVTFDDSGMAIRFEGPKRVLLADVRRLAKPSTPASSSSPSG
ncbi:hypothetical protein QO010_001870 [Caulobacter ginsengisoli]|uniref:Uncharacterized protein n=1 Tax=Caulobacter ginsengisoli TaxID=400775 RepID=A0ABU0IST9_9CAUL|nr:hypothetical protein [Caulobacter ginsengisoli]MDQ0464099.1 hypothetical protein [Caulobacter ginsengisoli]